MEGRGQRLARPGERLRTWPEVCYEGRRLSDKKQRSTGAVWRVAVSRLPKRHFRADQAPSLSSTASTIRQDKPWLDGKKQQQEKGRKKTPSP